MSQLDLFEERAAIKEFEGGMTRHEAEKQAREETSLRIKADDMAVYREIGWSTAKAIRMEARSGTRRLNKLKLSELRVFEVVKMMAPYVEPPLESIN